MKKKTLISIGLIALVVITIFISIFIYKNYNYKIDISQINKSWSSIDSDLASIKSNMDSITESNEDFYWWKLKDFDIEDDDYEGTLNYLVSSIRMCYIGYVDDERYDYSNAYNVISNFKNEKTITKRELKKLNEDMYREKAIGCLTRIEGIPSLLISNDENLRNKVLDEINYFITVKNSSFFENKDASYNELLFRKAVEIHLIKDLSDFLKEEYNNLK